MNYYDDNPGQGAPAPAEEPKGAETKGGADQTALLPKAILMGKDFKVGDEVVLKITADHGEEVEVSYAPEKKEEGEEETPPAEQPAAAPAAGGEMSSMYD